MIEQLLERSTQQKRQQDQTDKEKQTNGWRQSDSDSHTLYEKIDEDEDEIKLEEQRQAHDPQEEQAHIEDETEPARRTILQLYENLFFCEYLLFFLDCAILYISGTITAAHPPPILLAAGLISLIAVSIRSRKTGQNKCTNELNYIVLHPIPPPSVPIFPPENQNEPASQHADHNHPRRFIHPLGRRGRTRIWELRVRLEPC